MEKKNQWNIMWWSVFYIFILTASFKVFSFEVAVISGLAMVLGYLKYPLEDK